MDKRPNRNSRDLLKNPPWQREDGKQALTPVDVAILGFLGGFAGAAYIHLFYLFVKSVIKGKLD